MFMTQGVLKTHAHLFDDVIGMLVRFITSWISWEEKDIYIYIDFQTCMHIYIRLIIYSYFYLFKYSTNKHHRKHCIYTHRI